MYIKYLKIYWKLINIYLLFVIEYIIYVRNILFCVNLSWAAGFANNLNGTIVSSVDTPGVFLDAAIDCARQLIKSKSTICNISSSNFATAKSLMSIQHNSERRCESLKTLMCSTLNNIAQYSKRGWLLVLIASESDEVLSLILRQRYKLLQILAMIESRRKQLDSKVVILCYKFALGGFNSKSAARARWSDAYTLLGRGPISKHCDSVGSRSRFRSFRALQRLKQTVELTRL